MVNKFDIINKFNRILMLNFEWNYWRILWPKNQKKNATKGKDSNKRDYPNGNTRDNSKTHLKSGGGRNSGRGNNGGRR